jgi:hypothetical protein
MTLHRCLFLIVALSLWVAGSQTGGTRPGAQTKENQKMDGLTPLVRLAARRLVRSRLWLG